MNLDFINGDERSNDQQFNHCPRPIQLNQILMDMISNGQFYLLKSVSKKVGLSERTCQRHLKSIFGMRYKELVSKYQKKTPEATRDLST